MTKMAYSLNLLKK